MTTLRTFHNCRNDKNSATVQQHWFYEIKTENILKTSNEDKTKTTDCQILSKKVMPCSRPIPLS